MEDETPEAQDQAVLDDEQSADASETLATTDTDAAETGQAQDAGSEDEIDFEQYVGGKPQPNDPNWVSMQADYTRKTQAIAKERKLGEKLRALGIEPGDFLQQLDVLQANPHLIPQSAPTTTPAPAAPFMAPSGDADPVASDPEVVGAQEDYQAAVSAYGEGSLEAKIAARQLRTLTQFKQREVQAQQAAQYQQWQQATAARQSDFARLDTDALAKPLLQNPQIRRDVEALAAQTGIPVETALLGRYGREAISRAEATGYKRGFEEGRNARAKAKDASMQPGRSAQTVEQSVDLRYDKNSRMAGLWEQAKKTGARLRTG